MKHNLPPDPHVRVDPPGNGDPAKPVGDQVLLVQDGDSFRLMPLGSDTQGSPAKAVATKDQANLLASDFVVTLSDGTGYTVRLRNVQHGMVSLWVQRLGTDPNRPMPRAPNHGDDLLMPAVAAILKHLGLIQQVGSGSLLGISLDQVKADVQIVADSDDIILNFSQVVRGATINKVGAQVRLADVVKLAWNNGLGRATQKSYVLGEELNPVELFITKSNQDAQDSKHLIETVKHQTEAETLARVKQAIAGQTGAAATTPVGQPVVGAHAPGQSPVPPGAMPLSVVPDPKHPKPKRRGTSGPKGKPPKGSSTPPA